MSRELSWLVDGLYNALDISGSKSTITKRSKKAGKYSKNVTTDTQKNLQSSAIKVGNAMRRVSAEV